MASVKQVTGTRTAVTTTGLSTLASGAYATSNTVNNTTNGPTDLLVELSATTGTVGGNTQMVLFGIASLDGTNFQTGTNATDESVMTLIGLLGMKSNGVLQDRSFGVAAAFGGVLPPYIKFVVKNEVGATLTTGNLYVAEVSYQVV